MKYITYFSPKKPSVNYYLNNNISEVIFEHSLLSRFGGLNTKELCETINQFSSSQIKISLEWDILMSDNDFSAAVNVLGLLPLNKINSIRAQDPGAISYLRERTNLKITPILETANNNTESIKSWVIFCGEQLDRIVLGLELPKNKIQEIVREVNVPFEYSLLSPILLFYTPRKLVSPQFIDEEEVVAVSSNTDVEVVANSQETPHKGFRVVENRNGTFMFHPKDHSVLDSLDDLKEIKIDTLKIDLRKSDISILENVKQLISSKDLDYEGFKQLYPHKLIRGFFGSNKSTSVFPKLKNMRIAREDKNYLGEVLDVQKGKYLSIKSYVEINDILGKRLSLKTPDGKIKNISVKKILSTELKNIKNIRNGQIFLLPHLSGISVKTAVYLE